MDYGDTHDIRSKPKPGPSKQKHVKFVHGPTNQDSFDTLSPSSSSCGSSSDDFFLQVNPQILPNRGANDNPPHPSWSVKPYENDEFDLSNEGSAGSASQFSDIMHDSTIPIQFSPTLSPPAQVMLRPIVSDLDRIPPSIFSKSSTPTEWSVASNDSLFSIHIGEISFSRDHICELDLDLTESGELLHSPSRADEIIEFGLNSPGSKGIEPYIDLENCIIEDVKIEGLQVMDEPKEDGTGGLVRHEVDTVKIDPRRGCFGPNRLPEKSQVCVENVVKPIKNKTSSSGMCHSGGCPFSWSFKCCLSCFKCRSCFCMFSSWSCCKCSFWSCFKCSSWSCCKCRCLNCTWACCYCRKRQQKKTSCDSPAISSDTTSKSSVKTKSRSKYSCFSCLCCSCWSCSCCC